MPQLHEYLELSHMMVLASLDADKNPYTSNVYFAYHPETYVCYFISRPTREHAKHIMSDNKIAWSVINTEKYRPTDRDKKGLQFQGKCEMMSEQDGKEIFERYYNSRIAFQAFPEGHRVFACIPERVKIWDESLYSGEGKVIIF